MKNTASKRIGIILILLLGTITISCFQISHNNQAQGQAISSSSSGKLICQSVFSSCSCKKTCLAFLEGSMIVDCARSCSTEEISTYEPECMFSGVNCVDFQGDECKCPPSKYFDGTKCTTGTLDCFNPVAAPVCGCNNKTFQNSCLAKASGVKKFTGGGCSFQSILNCKTDENCPLGICPNGKIYKRFNCITDSCL